MKFLLKIICAAIKQAWDKEFLVENTKSFSNCCSELREIRKMSINRLCSENGCANLRLHIFRYASEEAVCIVAYLQDKAKFKQHLLDRKMPCSTYQTHNDFEVRTSSRSMKCSNQKADIGKMCFRID